MTVECEQTESHSQEMAPAWTSADLAGDPHERSDKPERVRRMFASIAGSYDLNNRLHSFGRDRAWRRAAVRTAVLRASDDVLDVACGTGDLAFGFARAGAASVVGLDFTPEMLDQARRRAAGHSSIEGVRFIEGDAQELPFEDSSFDVVSIAFGIRNVADPAKAIGEFRRVLRPGGRLVILEFGTPRFAPVAWMNTLYCQHVMPRTAAWIARDRSGAYKYLPRSISTFLDRDEMVALIGQGGFSDVSARPMTFGVCVCYRGLIAATER